MTFLEKSAKQKKKKKEGFPSNFFYTMLENSVNKSTYSYYIALKTK